MKKNDNMLFRQQNLNLSIRKPGWILDSEKFRIYLKIVCDLDKALFSSAIS